MLHHKIHSGNPEAGSQILRIVPGPIDPQVPAKALKLREGAALKQHPHHADKIKRDAPADRQPHLPVQLSENSLRHLKEAMKKPPQNKGPACSVPEAAHQVHDHNVHIGAKLSPPAASEREINIFPEK